MKCPRCGSGLSAFRVVMSTSDVVTCKNCGTAARVSGLWAFLIVPMVAFTFFPYWLLPDSWWQVVAYVSVALASAFVLSYRLFVRVSWL
jgi:uncharacterized protein (DUF983 family)